MESLLCLQTTPHHAEGGIKHNGAMDMMGPRQLVMTSTGGHLAIPRLNLLGCLVDDARLGMVVALSRSYGQRLVIRLSVAISLSAPWLLLLISPL